MFDEQLVYNTLLHLAQSLIWLDVIYKVAWASMGLNLLVLGFALLKGNKK